MYTTTDTQGILNNYSKEPEVYFAEYPNPEQQKRYAAQGAVVAVFIALVTLVAIGVS